MSWEDDAPHVALSIQYCEEIISGEIPACKWTKLACQRQLREFNEGHAEFYFDGNAAEAVCEFIEKLRHVKGIWAKRRETIVLEAWQCFILTTIFGWKREVDLLDESGTVIARKDTRRFRTALVEVPRKNAKSTLAAGIGLYLLSEDNEEGAEIYSAATTRAQAKIVFGIARQMALLSDDLAGLDVRIHNINHMESGSKFEPLHAEGSTMDGLNVHGVINDEVHAWKSRDVYDVIETAVGAREQPLIFNITTAGYNLAGICYELRGYLQRLLEGNIEDDTFFGIIYTIDPEDEWTDPATWRKANPNWNVSVYPMDIERMARKAMELPSQVNAFLTKRLDVWCNAATAWMDMVRWAACAMPDMKLDDFRGEDAMLGIDLASKIDVNSQAILFKRVEDGVDHYYCFMRHWLPEAAVNDDVNNQYDGWVRSGHIKTTPGNVIDVDVLEADTKALEETINVLQLGVDPGHNATQYAVHMAEEGFTVIDVRPTVLNFSEPMKYLEAWVKDGVFHHNCSVLTWMVSNVVGWRDYKDNIYPRKETPSRKIDGVIAVLIAINRMLAEDTGASVYDTRGVISV